jgi:hypothetical protein
MHYIFFSFYSLTPTYVSALTMPSVDYEPPEDGLVRAETYVGVKE